MTGKTHTIILKALYGEFADPQAEMYLEAAIENELNTDNYTRNGGRWTIRTRVTPKQIMDFIEENGYGFYDVISIDGQNWSAFYDSVIASIKTRNTKGADKMPEPAEDGRIHLSWGEVSNLFYEYNRLTDWNDYKAAIVAYVVYSNDTQSWRRHDYSLESRTYAFGSNNKAFIPGMGGYSIFAQNLDRTDFTRIEHVDWVIEDVYLDKSEYDRMMKIINAGTRVKTQSKSKKPVRKTTTKRSVKK